MEFHQASSLKSRTFWGLILSQFLAAFNDQAIHASAMFYVIHKGTLSEPTAISLMPILFFAPWAIFCTLAGYLSDRFSKRSTLVFWKVAEVAITLVALLGFWLGTEQGQPYLGSYIVLSTVFLMGMHSAFFVPAKYGVMPEILEPQLLSKGNGALESTSFLAVILGTVTGGLLSGYFKDDETKIGFLLVSLALLGTLASLLIRKMPAANPTRPFPFNPIKPLVKNLGIMMRSRPLALSILGIAFFTFMVAFMRATMYMHGQAQAPKWDELKTSWVVATVALGVGLGSPLAGNLSGGKVELGLVPLGALGMIAAAFAAAGVFQSLPGLVAALIAIGFFSGFYIVPLYTLLQHRAPKASKGDLIATSNFINVTGAIAASLLFYSLEKLALLAGITSSDNKEMLPRYLFLAAGLMTAGILYLLCRQLPDFFVRALLWLRSVGRYRLRAKGLYGLPTDGPAILATNCDRFDTAMQIIAATDRYTRFVLIQAVPDLSWRPLLRYLAARTGMVVVRPEADDSTAWEKARSRCRQGIAQGQLVGISACAANNELVGLMTELTSLGSIPVYPVYCDLKGGLVHLIVGSAINPSAGLPEIRASIAALAPPAAGSGCN